MASVGFSLSAAAAAAAAAAAWAAPCWDCGLSMVPGLPAVKAHAFLSQIDVMAPSSGISLRVTGFPHYFEAAQRKVRSW